MIIMTLLIISKTMLGEVRGVSGCRCTSSLIICCFVFFIYLSDLLAWRLWQNLSLLDTQMLAELRFIDETWDYKVLNGIIFILISKCNLSQQNTCQKFAQTDNNLQEKLDRCLQSEKSLSLLQSGLSRPGPALDILCNYFLEQRLLYFIQLQHYN